MTTILLLLNWGEAADWQKSMVAVLPAIGGLAATILVTFGVQQIWAKREAAITEVKRLLAETERLPHEDSRAFTTSWADIENRMISVEEAVRSGTIEAIIEGARTKTREVSQVAEVRT